MTKWSWALALCLSIPISATAEEKEDKEPKPAKPFRRTDFAVHSAQALNKGSKAFTAEIGYPFTTLGVLYGVGGILNVGAQLRSEWTLTVGGDVEVMATVYKTKLQALAVKLDAGILTLGTGDANVLAFGPGFAGVGDGTRDGLPHAFSATTHATITPQIVWSHKDTVGVWFLSGGATIQQFLADPLDLPAGQAVKPAFLPRLTVGIEQVSSSNLSFHFEGLAGAYIDPNVGLDEINFGSSQVSAIVMAQIGLNLYLP